MIKTVIALIILTFLPAQATGWDEQKIEKDGHAKHGLEVLDVVDIKRKGRYLLGRVVDSKGQPLTGALIQAVGEKGAPAYSAASRRNGEFNVMAPLGDKYTLVVTMTKYKKLEKKVE